MRQAPDFTAFNPGYASRLGALGYHGVRGHWRRHPETGVDTGFSAQKGMFAFAGVIKPVTSLGDLGAVLAGHPLFAEAWTQKLCAYANSAPCVHDDPEFLTFFSVVVPDSPTVEVDNIAGDDGCRFGLASEPANEPDRFAVHD